MSAKEPLTRPGQLKVQCRVVLPAPWTQTIKLSWRPELRFYEERIGILRELQDRGLLQAFRVGDNHVDARLQNPRYQLSVRESGLTMHLLAPDAEPDEAWNVLAPALDLIRPSRPREMATTYAHVAALDQSFDEAVARGYSGLFGSLDAGGARFDDWALLADVYLDSISANGLIEFGIVRTHEIEARLTRRAGRTTSGDPYPPISPTVMQGLKIPKVALFSDSTFRRPADQHGNDFATRAREFWEASRTQADSLVGDLHQRLSIDDDDRAEGGPE